MRYFNNGATAIFRVIADMSGNAAHLQVKSGDSFTANYNGIINKACFTIESGDSAGGFPDKKIGGIGIRMAGFLVTRQQILIGRSAKPDAFRALIA